MVHDSHAQAQGAPGGELRQGAGGYWLWYARGAEGPAIPLGIYDHPSDPDAAPQLRSVEVADVGVVPIAAKLTSATNYVYRHMEDALHELLGGPG